MKNNYYFYILKCKDSNKYYGHTNNLSEDVTCGARRATLSYLSELILDIRDVKDLIRPLNLRSFHSVSLGLIKNGKTRESTIEKLLNSFPKTKCQGFNSRNTLRSSLFRKVCVH